MQDYKNKIESLRQKFGVVSSRDEKKGEDIAAGAVGTHAMGGSVSNAGTGADILNKIDQLKAVLQKTGKSSEKKDNGQQ